jgi:hypothetical protein
LLCHQFHRASRLIWVQRPRKALLQATFALPTAGLRFISAQEAADGAVVAPPVSSPNRGG